MDLFSWFGFLQQYMVRTLKSITPRCPHFLNANLLCIFVYYCFSASQHCNAPDLDGGYFVPFQQRYPHKTNLSYSCDNGLKPAVEGWWAISTCENGEWSPTPQCIGKCLINISTGFFNGGRNISNQSGHHVLFCFFCILHRKN